MKYLAFYQHGDWKTWTQNRHDAGLIAPWVKSENFDSIVPIDFA